MIEVFLAPAPWNDLPLFGEQVISGLATGSIYALLALASVLIYRSTDVVTFAPGELAMLLTFSLWSLPPSVVPPGTLCLSRRVRGCAPVSRGVAATRKCTPWLGGVCMGR